MAFQMLAMTAQDRRGLHKPSLIAFGFLDFFLIILHAGIGWLVLSGHIERDHWPVLLNISRDWSLAEIAGYFKWAILIAVLLRAFFRSSERLFSALAFFFLITLLDDALQLHEQVGGWIVHLTGLHLSIGSKAFALGEIAIWLLLGLLGISVVAAAWRSTDDYLRAHVLPLLGFFAVLILFAVGVDLIHFAVPDYSAWGGIVGIMEDGGEMLIMTVMLSYGIIIARTYPVD